MKRTAIVLLVILPLVAHQGTWAQGRGRPAAGSTAPGESRASSRGQETHAMPSDPSRNTPSPQGVIKSGAKSSAKGLLDGAQAVVQQLLSYYRSAVDWLERHGLLLS